jgi:acetolactate synthase-1/2/3 large subunit
VITGGRLLVDALIANGAERAFCVPGESYLPVLDALYDVQERLPLVVCRHESGAANMAEAYGKLTGRPGIAFVTRGPGACNASIGIHTARQDATPMILFAGQVPRALRGREAFQEVDLVAMFAPLAKWSAQIDDAGRIPEIVAHAYVAATTGLPGPVVIALPEDVLSARVAGPASTAGPRAQPRLDAGDAARIRAELERAERPLIIAGGGPWSAPAAGDLAAFAADNALPVAVEFRCQDFIDNDHPSYAGVLGLGAQPALTALVQEADLILALGARLSDVATQGYTLLAVPQPQARLLHVASDAGELGRVYQPALAAIADPGDAVARLRDCAPIANPVWASRTQAAHAALLRSRELPPSTGAGVDLAAFVAFLRERLPDDAIIVNGAGNFTTWLHRFFSYRRYGTQVAPRSGAMGYGVPAAVAAKLAFPHRSVVCFTGDGDFLMSGNELATAVMYDAAIVIIVVNNAMYGTIRMHQERHYPQRVLATHLVNPDFAAYARAFGAYGELVETSEGAAAAFERAVRSGGPALLELRVDRNALTPSLTINNLRASARAGSGGVRSASGPTAQP